MGVVYRARDTRLGRAVAIKLLPAHLSSDASHLKRFEQEAQSAAALNHPSILALYQLGSYQGAPRHISSQTARRRNPREQLQLVALSQQRAPFGPLMNQSEVNTRAHNSARVLIERQNARQEVDHSSL